MIRTKDLTGGIKDVDVGGSRVKIALAGLGNVDAQGDMIKPGAFTKTIKENGPKGKGRIKHFKNHFFGDVPGVFLELFEEGEHLIAISQLSRSTLGRDTLLEYQDGVITEHSIGFEVMKEEPEKDDDGNTKVNHLLEIFLWEGSSLTAWGANSNTPYLGSKQLTERLERLEKALSVNGLSDERLHEYEKQITEVKELITALSQGYEPPAGTRKGQPLTLDEILRAIRQS